jgi:polyisoprenoid-binding protein YceI
VTRALDDVMATPLPPRRPRALRTVCATGCAWVAFAAAPAPALSQTTYTIDGEHTTPLFEVRHMGMSLQRGFFTNTSGKIVLDRAARTGSIDVVIGTGSVVTGSRVLTDVLKRDDFFNAEKYPTMRFVARELTFDGEVPVAAKGELTLLDVTRPVVLAIADFHCGAQLFTRRPMCAAEATATIRRSDFGMTYGIPRVAGDDIRIVIPVEAFAQ